MRTETRDVLCSYVYALESVGICYNSIIKEEKGRCATTTPMLPMLHVVRKGSELMCAFVRTLHTVRRPILFAYYKVHARVACSLIPQIPRWNSRALALPTNVRKRAPGQMGKADEGANETDASLERLRPLRRRTQRLPHRRSCWLLAGCMLMLFVRSLFGENRFSDERQCDNGCKDFAPFFVVGACVGNRGRAGDSNIHACGVRA